MPLVSDFEFLADHKPCIEEFFDIIDSACHFLQESTNCPDEAINQLLTEAIGTWQLPNLEQLDKALERQISKDTH